MSRLPPILAARLFRDVSAHLLALLRSLDADDWHRPTVSSERNVKDIVSHLLDGSLRRLSMQRDGYVSPDTPRAFGSASELTAYLHRINGEWTRATRRLSPLVLIHLTEWADAGLADLFESLDPHGPAIFPVAWAGEAESEHWLDVARDYTEKWHHTQQIFEATGRPSTITIRRLFHPCLDTFMRALPYTLRTAQADEGAVVAVHVLGEAGGTWFAVRRGGDWEQVADVPAAPTATVTLDQDAAWKLCTKRRTRAAVLAQFPDIRITGDAGLGSHVLDMVSVMA